MENRGRTKRTRGGGEIIEGERGNKGWIEINKKKNNEEKSREDSREVYIYIYTRPTFLKRIDL